MQRSEDSLSNLFTALAKAQAEIKGAIRDSDNPFFHSKYADLSSVWACWQEVGPKNGLSIIQAPVSSERGVGVETTLCHESGEWVSEVLILPFPTDKSGELKADAQSGGSCITYARRYALAAFVGICPEDDDGNAAAAAQKARDDHDKKAKEQAKAKADDDPDFKQMVDAAIARLKAEAQKGTAALQAEWIGIGPKDDAQAQEIRNAIHGRMGMKWWTALKAQASAVGKEAAHA